MRVPADFRSVQFPGLAGKAYLDWTGAALPPRSLIDADHERLTSHLYGNPHSHHAPSAAAMEEVVATRAAVLKYFNADPAEYEVIFASGATGAIRLLEHYRFEGGELLMLADNHNSVNGLRETARRNGAVHRYSPIKDDLSIDADALMRRLSYPRSNGGQRLFAYPAKSNWSGAMHSLDWVRIAHEKGWDVLLDAAAYSSNCRLDLRAVKPDFVPVSFYKIFGYPTGIGCLLVRKEAYARLHKKWFAGGSILIVSVAMDFHAPETLGYARYEDGTVNFQMIPSVMAGLKFAESLGDVQSHASGLATAFYDRLAAMAGDAAPIIHSARGNDTVTFSIKRGRKIVDSWQFEKFASPKGVFVRTGCFCNPGPNEVVFGYDVGTFADLYNDAIMPDAITIERLGELSGGRPIGAIRASFGYANDLSDVSLAASTVAEFLAL